MSKPTKTWVVTSLAQVAQFFGRSERTIANWRAAGMPILSKSRYDLQAIMRWHEARTNPIVPESGETLQEIKARALEAKANIAETADARAALELAEYAAEVMPTATARTQVAETLIVLRARLAALLADCTASTGQFPEVAQEMASRIDMACRELASRLPFVDGDAEVFILAVADEIRARRLAAEAAGDE